MEGRRHTRSEDENQATHIQPDVDFSPQWPRATRRSSCSHRLGPQASNPEARMCGAGPSPLSLPLDTPPKPGSLPRAQRSPIIRSSGHHSRQACSHGRGLCSDPAIGNHGSGVPRTHTTSAGPLGGALHPGVSSPVGKNSATQSLSPLTRIIPGPLSKGIQKREKGKMPCTQKRWFICSANIYQVPDLGQVPVQAGDPELGGTGGFLPRPHPGSNGSFTTAVNS